MIEEDLMCNLAPRAGIHGDGNHVITGIDTSVSEDPVKNLHRERQGVGHDHQITRFALCPFHDRLALLLVERSNTEFEALSSQFGSQRKNTWRRIFCQSQEGPVHLPARVELPLPVTQVGGLAKVDIPTTRTLLIAVPLEHAQERFCTVGIEQAVVECRRDIALLLGTDEMKRKVLTLTAEGSVDLHLQEGWDIPIIPNMVDIERHWGPPGSGGHLPVGSEVVIPLCSSAEYGELAHEAIETGPEFILRNHIIELHDDLERVPRTGSSLVHVVECMNNPVYSCQVVLVLGERDAHH